MLEYTINAASKTDQPKLLTNKDVNPTPETANITNSNGLIAASYE